MSDRCPFDGIKPSRSNQLMVDNDVSAFAKVLLGKNNALARRPISFSS